MEKTLVILKPCAVQRAIVGQVTARFERKGLRLAGMKMMQLTDELLDQHYAHLASKPFFQRIKNSMMGFIRSWRRNTRQRCGHSRRARSLSARRLKVLWYVRRPKGTLEP